MADELKALTEYNWVLWVAGLFALLEFARWVFSIKDFLLKRIGIKTKGMLEREAFENRLKQVEKSIEEIKDTSKHNVDMFLEHEKQVVDKFTDIKCDIVSELNRLHDKMDGQQSQLEKTEKEGKKRDRAFLRDRISGGMRFFEQNRDEDGEVHISVSDHENMEALFKEYFNAGGNGTFKQMYENEFKKFIIDK